MPQIFNRNDFNQPVELREMICHIVSISPWLKNIISADGLHTPSLGRLTQFMFRACFLCFVLVSCR